MISHSNPRYFHNDSSFTSRPTCTLTAGGDEDKVQIGTSSNSASDDAAAGTLTVAHTFPVAGTAALSCTAGSAQPATLNNVKITAIRLGKVTSTSF